MDGAADTARWTRSALLFCLALAAAAVTSTAWLVHPWYDTTTGANDTSVYVLCAQALLRGEGYSYLGHPFLLRPPGFSALLVPALAAFGLDFHALNLYVALWGVACVVLLAVFLRQRIGTALALGAALLAWTNPLFQTFCSRLMSDVPATAVLVLALLVERWAARRESWKRDVVLGVVIGLSAYLRSASVLILGAVACARIVARWTGAGRRAWPRFAAQRLGPVILATLLVLLPWSIHAKRSEGEVLRDQTYSVSYSTFLFREERGDPESDLVSGDDLLRRVGRNVVHVAGSLGSRLRRAEHEPTSPADVAFGVASFLLALPSLVRRRGAADFLLVFLLTSYLGSPSFWLRHLLPVFLLLVPAGLDTLAWLGSRLAPRARVNAVLAVLVCLLAAHDFEPRRGWAGIQERYERFVTGSAAIAAALPPDAVLAAPVGWHLSVHLQRPVFSLAPATAHEKRLDAVEGVIDGHHVNTVVVADFAGGEQRLEQYLVRRHGPGQVVGEARLFRVRP